MLKPIILDDWQEDILNRKGNVLLCTGRQVGKTTIFARKAAKRMLEQAGCTIVCASITEDQAKLIIVMILDFIEANNRGMIARGRNKPTLNKITLRNGSSVIARPVGNTGDAIRGFTGDVLYLDEASRMSKIILDAAKPLLLTTAGDIWLSSTPFGKEGYFWEMFERNQGREDGMFYVYHISSEQVIRERPISQGWTETQRVAAIKFLENEKRTMSELSYGQEYLGLFLDEMRRYFTDELINKCCTLQRPKTIGLGEFSLGVDIARMGDDESTFEILKKISKDNIIQVENIVTKKQLTTQTEERIILLNRQYDFKNIFIDAGAGSLGVGIFDHLLSNEETKRKVVAVNNRQISMDREGKKKQRLLKEDLYDNLRNLMERGVLKLLDDENLRLSLASIQEEFPKEEVGLSKRRIHGNYSHIAEGLIRAAVIGKEKDINIWIRSIRV